MSITQHQAKISATAYAILASGGKYEFRLKNETTDSWTGPFGFDDIDDILHFSDNIAELREYVPPIPQVRFHLLDNNNSTVCWFPGNEKGLDSARAMSGQRGFRVARMVEDLTFKG